jgi:hypothetical protein
MFNNILGIMDLIETTVKFVFMGMGLKPKLHIEVL